MTSIHFWVFLEVFFEWWFSFQFSGFFLTVRIFQVPGLFEGDDYTTLMTQCKEGSQREGLMLDSSEELYKWFTQQVSQEVRYCRGVAANVVYSGYCENVLGESPSHSQTLLFLGTRKKMDSKISIFLKWRIFTGPGRGFGRRIKTKISLNVLRCF